MRAGEPSSFRLVATLGLAGLLSGAVLVGVFLLTEPRIRRNQAEALRRAIYNVLPGTTAITTYVIRDGGLVAYEGPEGSVPAERAVYAGESENGTRVGYAIPAQGPGFMDTIKLIYGLVPERRVIVGMQVLDSRETPGLGDRIITDPDFLSNFTALEVAPRIVPVKRGAKSRANEVDCITGATISSEAVVGILDRSSKEWLPLLETVPTRAEAGSHAD